MSREEQIVESTKALEKNIEEYLKLQTEELSDSFELIYKLNQAAMGRFGELEEEAGQLAGKAHMLQEQEIGIASFLSNLGVIESDLTRLEETIGKLEGYCSLLESKIARAN